MARTFSWYSAGQTFADTPIVLHNEAAVPFRVLRAVGGLEAPQVTVRTIASPPGVHGVRFESATAYRSDVSVPVFLEAESRAEFRRLKAEMIAALMPFRGAGRLVLTDGIGTDPGTARYVTAWCRSGLEGDESQAGPNWWRFVLRFECSDPFWYSFDSLRASWVGKPVVPFSPFTIPFTISEYGVDVDTPLEVAGDADTYPSFELRGPFTRVRVTNLRSQRLIDPQPDSWWEVARETAGSEMLRVVTKPNEVSVRLYRLDNAGAWVDAGSVWSVLTAGSSFNAPLAALDALDVTADGTSDATRFDLFADESWYTHG